LKTMLCVGGVGGLRVCGLWKVSESRRRRRKKRGWINFTCETGIGQIIAVLLMEQFH